MNLLKPHSIEEFIISNLQKGSFSAMELLERIKVSRPKTTKQALYSAIRKLRSLEIVVVHSMKLSLSSLWINKMSHFFSLAKQAYLDSPVSESFLNLKEGDRISYSFSDPHTTDIFWGHAFELLSESTKEPILIYNPHEWFILARKEAEYELFKNATNSGRGVYLLIGNETPIDRELAKIFQSLQVNYYTQKTELATSTNYYLNLFDDIIIEVYLDKKASAEIHDFYLSHTAVTNEGIIELKRIIHQQGRSRLVISRNQRKAKKIKSLFKKYFHIPNKK